MEFNGKEVNVVDYKTGDVNSDYTKKKLLAPNDKATQWRRLLAAGCIL